MMMNVVVDSDYWSIIWLIVNIIFISNQKNTQPHVHNSQILATVRKNRWERKWYRIFFFQNIPVTFNSLQYRLHLILNVHQLRIFNSPNKTKTNSMRTKETRKKNHRQTNTKKDKHYKSRCVWPINLSMCRHSGPRKNSKTKNWPSSLSVCILMLINCKEDEKSTRTRIFFLRKKNINFKCRCFCRVCRCRCLCHWNQISNECIWILFLQLLVDVMIWKKGNILNQRE